MSTSRVRIGILTGIVTVAGLLPLPIELPAVGTKAAAACPAMLSCGSGCIADLQVAFCIDLVDFTGKIEIPTPIGTITLGPSLRFTCQSCECWFTYINSNGNPQFMRTTEFTCGAAVEGLRLIKE